MSVDIAQIQEIADRKFLFLSELPIIKENLTHLENELPSELLYHNYKHTHSVLKESILFALHDNISDRELELIAIAAAYHDSGFIYQKENNESICADLAREAMKKTNQYTEQEITLVAKMIEDTRLYEVDGVFSGY